MSDPKLDLLQGTLDLMVLQTLAALGEQHGYGIARRIEQISGDTILLNQGTIYASLVRLQNRGWITAQWALRTTIVRPSTTPSRAAAGSSLCAIRRTGGVSPTSWAACSRNLRPAPSRRV
jgi:hypothetical protein